MSQNVYDRPDFFSAYISQIDRSYVPDITTDKVYTRFNTLLPPTLPGFTVLDLGCGTGWVARLAVDRGAETVDGVDISANMLERARGLSGDYPGISYRQADLETLELAEGEGGYDMVVSSLSMHYLVGLDRLVQLVYRALKPGGLFVFNVEHPIHTAPRKARVVEDAGERCYAFNGYYEEGERWTDWLAPGVKKQHRTMQSYMEMCLGSGLVLEKFLEWLPSEGELERGEVNEYFAIRPVFLMMRWRK